jgi:flagellar biosynthesis protein FliP
MHCLHKFRFYILLGLCITGVFVGSSQVIADDNDTSSSGPMGVSIKFDSNDSPEEMSKSIQIVLLLTALSLAPSAIIMCTSFTRIMIVFGLLRRALGTQSTPPGQVLAGLALFLTIFIMMPVWHKINDEAIQPYMNEEISQKEAFSKGVVPIRRFMSQQTGRNELALFANISGNTNVKKIDDVALETLIPAFMLSELKTAFKMGFLLYLPFLVIDLVIASCLMSMGMMMLPPMMISIPIKILLFVLADGWTLVVKGALSSFA